MLPTNQSKMYLLFLFALQTTICMAEVCSFIYSRGNVPRASNSRWSACYWNNKDFVACGTAADSLYKTLNPAESDRLPSCSYTAYDSKGIAGSEFKKFDSACADLGGSREIGDTSTSMCEDPDNLPFYTETPYTIKGAPSNSFWHNYLGNNTSVASVDSQSQDPKSSQLVGTDIISTIVFHYGESRYSQIMRKQILFLSIHQGYESGPARNWICLVNDEFRVVSQKCDIFQGVFHIEPASGGTYVFEVAFGAESLGYMKDVNSGTFAIGKNKDATAKWVVEPYAP